MNTLYLLIPVAIVLVAVAVRLFIWAVRSGQYDNLDMEGRRILFEEKEPTEARKPEKTPPESPE